MRRENFELSTFVDTDLETTFQFLSDLNNHRYLHPYFVQAEQISSRQDSGGNLIKEFVITERPRLGPFRYTIKFPTKMTITVHHEFTSEVHAAFATHLVNSLKCESENNGTRVVETVIIHAPWLTIRYVKRQAYIAHKRTFDLLPSALVKS
jgi:hypothetical protein